MRPGASDSQGAVESEGLGVTLRAALAAGALTGLVFGLADGIAAAWFGTADLSFLALLACLAASVALYALFCIGALAIAGLALHPILCARIPATRYVVLLSIGLALGIFAEIYWWSRPFVYYGRPSLSPERLAATLAMLVAASAIGIVLARALARFERGFRVAVGALVAVAFVAGGAYVLTASSRTAARGAINAKNRDMPNVLLVVVDAMRRDVLSRYGHPRVRTPAIDALAADGVLFENAFTQAPFTWTSFGSLLTGKYPRRHGLVQMKAGVRMSRDNVTLPYHLKRAKKNDGSELTSDDYLGGTFHTGTLSTGSGLLRGFDMYFEAMAGHDLVTLDDPWSVFRSDLLFYIFKNKLSQRFDSGIVASSARAWLAEHAGQRFVCMVHLYSTHTPYDPPAEFKREYCDPAYKGPIDAFYATSREKIESGEYTPTAADLAQIRNLYYAGVAQADALIGGIVKELEDAHVRRDTLVIVTADHGESLGEQDLWEHNHMVQTNLRVPLVMSWPGHLPPGVRVGALTDEIDVLPTICEIASIAAPHEAGERGKIDGLSLMPLVRGESKSVREYSFAENGLELSIQDLTTKLVVPTESLDPQAFERALTGGPALKPRLFDLSSDPNEEHNVIDARHADAERLHKALRAWSESMPTPLSEIEVSERYRLMEQRRLEGLGYAGGIGAGIKGNGHVPSSSSPGGTQSHDEKSPDAKAPKSR